MFPVVSAHFVGMFGLALFVGHVIDRVGRTGAPVGGLSLLGLCVFSMAWAVESVAATSVALFGLGLGRNFSYVAAMAELTERTAPVERGNLLDFTELLTGFLSPALSLLGGIALVTIGSVGLGVAGLALAVVPGGWILGTKTKQLLANSQTPPRVSRNGEVQSPL